MKPEHIELLKTLALFIGPLMGSAGLWAWLQARTNAKSVEVKARIEAPAAINTSHADLVAALTQQTKALLDDSAKDRRQLKRRVDAQGKQIAALTEKVNDCEQRHAGCEDNVSELKAQIDELMSKPVPVYDNANIKGQL